MDQFEELKESYTGSSPLYLQDEAVLFPKTGNDFRISDTVNIEMVNHALAHDRFITFALMKKDVEYSGIGPPPIYDVGTLSFVIDFKEIEDGDYNLLALGVNKVQINETEQSHPFRIGATTDIKEITDLIGDEQKKEHLIKRFEILLDLSEDDVPIQAFNDPGFSIEMMINMICVAMMIPATEKQKMLELQDINLRYDILVQFIDAEIKNLKRKILIPNIPKITLMD